MVPVHLLAGSEPATILASCFDMDIDDSKQHPWLEYSVWQDQEWVRIYTPGQPQRWHRGDAVPNLPENSFREWQRVTDPNAPVQAWDIRDWQHQGYQRILSRIATPFSHGDHPAASQIASVLYGDTRNAQRGDLSFPSSERFRAVSRSPRRVGYFGQR